MNAQMYTGVGMFENEWRNPPAPFNPDYDPQAAARYRKVTRSMQEDGIYRNTNLSREDRARIWRDRYDALKCRGE